MEEEATIIKISKLKKKKANVLKDYLTPLTLRNKYPRGIIRREFSPGS